MEAADVVREILLVILNGDPMGTEMIRHLPNADTRVAGAARE